MNDPGGDWSGKLWDLWASVAGAALWYGYYRLCGKGYNWYLGARERFRTQWRALKQLTALPAKVEELDSQLAEATELLALQEEGLELQRKQSRNLAEHVLTLQAIISSNTPSTPPIPDGSGIGDPFYRGGDPDGSGIGDPFYRGVERKSEGMSGLHELVALVNSMGDKARRELRNKLVHQLGASNAKN